MSRICNRHHLNATKKSDYSSLSASSEEKDKPLNEVRVKRSNESLTLTVKPEEFRLPFVSRAKATVVLENNNNSAVCFIVGTNSPNTLEIEPRTGCIDPREKVFITVKRPKKVIVTYKNEYLIFKIKYCFFCNSTENHRIDSDNYHARYEESSFEKHEDDIYGNLRPNQDSHHLKLSKKRHLTANESYEIICRNEISFKPSSKRDAQATYPKQFHEIYRKKNHHEKAPNEFKSIHEEHFKPGLYRKEASDGDSSDEAEAMKRIAKCRCNECSMPKTKKKCENEMLKCHCHWSSGIKCSNKNKFQQKEYCIRDKSGKVCCGCVQKHCKSCDRGSCCHCKTCCNRKRNVCLQDTRSSDRDFKNGKYVDSKMRKRMKRDMQDKEFIEEDIIEGKLLQNIPKHHKVQCKCSVCSKQKRKLTSIDVSKKRKIKHIDLHSDTNENGFAESDFSKRMLWYSCIGLIMFVTIFAISMIVVYRKKLNILVMPLFNYFGFNTTPKTSSYWNRHIYK